MRYNKKPQKKNKYKKPSKYGSDVIAYYAQQKSNDYYAFLGVQTVDTESVHKIARKVFGKTYYIDFESFKML
jgi:hypothetical protein